MRKNKGVWCVMKESKMEEGIKEKYGERIKLKRRPSKRWEKEGNKGRDHSVFSTRKFPLDCQKCKPRNTWRHDFQGQENMLLFD